MRYPCAWCKYKATTAMNLQEHWNFAHEGAVGEIKEVRIAPLPPCDPSSPNHSSDCCDRIHGLARPIIYSKEERYRNGRCLEWNKGFCPNFDLCQFVHEEIEECWFGENCARQDCGFFHNVEGMFPFLEKKAGRVRPNISPLYSQTKPAHQNLWTAVDEKLMNNLPTRKPNAV